MPYIVTIGEQSYKADFKEQDGKLLFEIDGKSYVVDAQRISITKENGRNTSSLFSLIIDGKSHDVLVQKTEADGQQAFDVSINSNVMALSVQDARQYELSKMVSSSHKQDDAIIKAPMPGLLSSIPVKVGDSVKKGQTVAVLVAMKMENDLVSPRAGIVKDIQAESGSTITQGQALVVVGEE